MSVMNSFFKPFVKKTITNWSDSEKRRNKAINIELIQEKADCNFT